LGAERDLETPNVTDDDLHRLREVLDRSGFLSTERVRDRLTDREQPPLPAYLMSNLAALAGEFGSDSSRILRARRETAVAVHGTTRLAVSVAATLAASGVGWVQLVNGGDVSAADACPGGLTPSDEGRRFGVAAADAVRRAAPDVNTTPIPPDRSADLVILADPGPVDSAVRSSLHLDGLVHLAVSVIGLRAVVGPLVRPGISSCLRCADLHRSDRDPVWPALAVQLSGSGRRRSASDVGLCVAAAGLAATQALAYLDQQRPSTIDGTLEWQLPDWRLRRRTWPAHHGCDCGASADSVRARQNRNVIFR
jgi:bacteriocin biosynthesis cyclodehydratase domain-containing protein